MAVGSWLGDKEMIRLIIVLDVVFDDKEMIVKKRVIWCWHHPI
jgi:hypothetical protein